MGELKLLLLENISQEAVDAFKKNGFQVDHFKKAWSEDELIEKIGDYHAIGIRSKTRITEKVLKYATKVSLAVDLVEILCAEHDLAVSCLRLGAFASGRIK